MSWLCLSLLSRPHHLVSSTSLQTDLICLEPGRVKGPATEGNQGHSRESPTSPPPLPTHTFPLSLILPRGCSDQMESFPRLGGQPIPFFAKLAETTLFLRGPWVSQGGQAWRELQWAFPWETFQPGHKEKVTGCLVAPSILLPSMA